MTKPLTLFEHEFSAGFDWSDLDLAGIERVDRATGVEILCATTVRNGQREIKASEHIGVVGLGKDELQVRLFRKKICLTLLAERNNMPTILRFPL